MTASPARRNQATPRAGTGGGSAERRAQVARQKELPPDGRVCYLHIGTMKSGTTFLQQMLVHHRIPLGRDGILFPGRGSYARQIIAIRDAVNLPGNVHPQRLHGAWDDLCEEIDEWSGHTVVISVEHLSVAPPRVLPAVIDSLAPFTVHVVITARDLARVLPSTWQENIQNGLRWTWSEFLQSVTDAPDSEPTAGLRFWRQHDIVRIARIWLDLLGPDRVHLVTLPPPGAPPDLLWQRFSSVLGIDPEAYPVADADLRSNKGLDRAAAEMLRRVNVSLEDSADRAERAGRLRVLKRGVAKEALADRGHQLPILLDAEQYDWARRYSEQLVDDLAATGIDVVGDLRELVPPERSPEGLADVREPTDAEIADAAAAATAALLPQLLELRSGRRRRPGRRAEPAADEEDLPDHLRRTARPRRAPASRPIEDADDFLHDPYGLLADADLSGDPGRP